MSSGLNYLYDDHRRITHVMCPVCFAMTPLAELWRDEENTVWDLCSEPCAIAAGHRPTTPEETP